MALIKLNSSNVKAACIETLAALQKHIDEIREPIIQKRMSGFLGMFKCTRAKAIERLKAGSRFSEYNMAEMFWEAPTVCKNLILLSEASEDGFIFVYEFEWKCIKKFYKES